MHRIDNASATLVKPAYEAAGPNPDGHFQATLPGQGTIVSRPWAEQIQEELVGIATIKGAALNKADDTQCATALADAVLAIEADNATTGEVSTTRKAAVLVSTSGTASGVPSLVAASTSSGGASDPVASGANSAVVACLGIAEASGDKSLVAACESSVASGDISAAIASANNSYASGAISGVLACSAGTASGAETAVIGSITAEADGTQAVILASTGGGSDVSGTRAVMAACNGSVVDGTNAAAIACSAGGAPGAQSAAVASTSPTAAGTHAAVIASTSCVTSGGKTEQLVSASASSTVNADQGAAVACETVTVNGAQTAAIASDDGAGATTVDGTESAVIASQDCTTDDLGARCATLASSGCDVGGGALATVQCAAIASNACTVSSGGGSADSATLAADTCTVGGTTSAVIASDDSDVTSGTNSAVVASHDSGVTAADAIVIGSRFTTNDQPNSAAGGYAAAGPRAAANKTIRLQFGPLAGPVAAGTIFYNGALTAGGADYAELFQTAGGTALPERRIVTQTRGRVRLAQPGDRLLGVVSVHPTVLGNAGASCAADGGRSVLRDEWCPVGLLGQLEVEVVDDVAPGDFLAAGPDGIGITDKGNARRRGSVDVEVLDIVRPGVALCLVR